MPVTAGVRASIARPVQHPVETFSEAERARLAPHVTNFDRPVFALVNLPETVKGALFARYSRYQGTLRRLFLDEFAESAPQGHVWEGAEGRRAAALSRPRRSTSCAACCPPPRCRTWGSTPAARPTSSSSCT